MCTFLGYTESTLSQPRTRFQPSTDISDQTSVKSSVQRSLRANVLAQWNINPETLEEIWPKKESITLVKWSVNLPAVFMIEVRSIS